MNDKKAEAYARSPAEMIFGCTVAIFCALAFAAAVLGMAVYVVKSVF